VSRLYCVDETQLAGLRLEALEKMWLQLHAVCDYDEEGGLMNDFTGKSAAG
jgi:hypothetical protein